MQIYEGQPLTLGHLMLSDYALYYQPDCPNPNPHAELGYNFYIFDLSNRHLLAAKVNGREGAIEQWTEYTERHLLYWNNTLAHFLVDKDAGAHTHVIIKGRNYLILPDSNKPGPGDGFSGCRFHIVFNDGHEVVTHNLWYGGEIPPGYREMMQDNAKFKEGTVGHKLRWNEDVETPK